MTFIKIKLKILTLKNVNVIVEMDNKMSKKTKEEEKMKKFLSLAVIVLVAVIALSTNVFAAEVTTETDLKNALAGTDTTITLKGDVTLTAPIEVEREVTLDLNGHKVTATETSNFTGQNDYMFGVHRKAHLTIKDSGTNGKIENNGVAIGIIKMTIKGENDATYAAKFTLNGGTLETTHENATRNFAVIMGNGTRHNTEVVINGGYVKSKNYHGIYNPQDGKVTVNGGTIEGLTGIEMRAGTLTVTGGTIIGNGTTVNVEPNDDGETTTGVGIAIAQHNTEKEVKVVVNGGTVKGYAALYESNPENNTAIDKVSIEINDGTFEATNNGTKAIVSKDVENFVKGGTFNTAVEKDYVAEDLDAVEDENGNVLVGTLHKVTVSEVKNGKVTVDKTEALAGQTVTLTVKANEGYKVKTLKVTTKEGGFELTDEAFVMPDADVTVTAEFEEVVEEKTNDKENEEIEDKVDDDKDEEPKMGMEVSIITVLAVIAMVALAGYVVTKK